jgi:hypothetical protein
MFNTPASRNRLAVGAILAMALLGAGTTIAAEAFPPSILVLSQKPAGNTVSITYAYLPQNGTLRIYASDARGGMGPTRLGQVDVSVGDHRDVKIALSAAPERGTKLWAAVEHANGGLFKRQGKPVERSFKVL